MTGFRSDQNATPHPNRNQLLIQLHSGVGFAFEDIIDFGEGPVVMQTGRFENFGDMHRSREVGQVAKRPFRESARARHARDCVKVGDLVTGGDPINSIRKDGFVARFSASVTFRALDVFSLHHRFHTST